MYNVPEACKPGLPANSGVGQVPQRLTVSDPSAVKAHGLYQGNKRLGFKMKVEKEPLDRENPRPSPQRPPKPAFDRSVSPTFLPSHRPPFSLHATLSSKTFHTLDTQLPIPPPRARLSDAVGSFPAHPRDPSQVAPIWSDQSIPTEQLNLPLMQPFLRLSSNKHLEEEHSFHSDGLSHEDRPVRMTTRNGGDLDEDALVGETSLLDSPTRTMTADELMEMYLDEFDSIELKQLSRGYSAAQPRQSDPTPVLPQLLKRSVSGEGAMEIEWEDSSENLSETKLIFPQLSRPPGTACCTCKKSKCLKLYCECFRTNGFCSEGCSCTECYNRVEYADVRDQFYTEQLQRNPASFSSKIVAGQGAAIYARGCNCKKTECLKNYCECFAAKVKCSHLCRCTECQNCDPAAEAQNPCHVRERQVKKRRKSEKNFQQSLRDRLASRKPNPDAQVAAKPEDGPFKL